MGRIPRCQLPDGLFHVTTNSVHEVPAFRDDLDRDFFWRLMRRLPFRFGVAIHVYCLLGTHYHMLVEATTDELGAAFEWLNGVYAREHNARHGRRGHLFRERFSSWVVRDELPPCQNDRIHPRQPRARGPGRASRGLAVERRSELETATTQTTERTLVRDWCRG